MKYLVVIASIRQELPGFEDTMGRIQATFKQPTEFHVLDGHQGKAQALNRATDEILQTTDADCYVTMDDDIVPGERWQELIEQAFKELPTFGAFGLWMGDDPISVEIMQSKCLEPDRTAGQLRYRRVIPPHHLNGGFIAYRTAVARQIGRIPTEGTRYQLWEDAWRGRRVTKLGWEMAFIKGAEVEMIDYPDGKDYLAEKEEAIVFGRAVSDRILRNSGIGDPASIRIRKWIARLRGRA